MKRLFILTLAFALFYAAASPALAQEQPTQKPTEEELEKEKAEREKNAFRLLDQVIDEAQSLRLTENRVRVQINAADALWDKNQGRARSLFTMAADGIAELTRNPQPTGNRPNSGPNQDRRAFQLRQELVLAAAKHDAQLAYQILATTKPPVPIAQNTNPGPRQPMVDPEDNLEQMLLGRIAALDPKLAAQNAEQMMEKGQFPRTLTEVIARLAQQDPEAGSKLADKTVKKIQASNILTNNEAAVLAQQLLNSGIRQPAADTAAVNQLPAGMPLPRGPVLEQSAYVDLLSSVIDAALKVSSPSQNPQNPQQRPAAAAQRGRPQGPNTQAAVVNRPGGPTPEQIEQMNGRRLMASIMIALPVIDQHLPSKAPAVRQKLAELGAGNLGNMGQPVSFPQGAPTVDSLVQAAANAPAQMKDRLYQQAAYRALEEGNVDRARQIATDYLPQKSRDILFERIQYRELIRKADGARFEEIRQAVNRLQTDNEKLELLLQLAGDAQKTNPKLVTQLLEEARQLTNRRATNYDHFNQQLRVAHAYIAVDPARSFEVLEPAISHINELLSAAAILNGFEISMFRDGEMAMQGGSGLTSTINRFGQELASLARTDFERADTLAGRFQLTEPRIMTRLLIVQGLLNPPRTDPRSGIGPFNVGRVSENVQIARP